jgi:hypothetical protein
MSLIHKQEMTEENLAAKRTNGRMTQGPVTPEGKANSAAANLRHGFYCQSQNRAIAALGEDAQEYADLMNSLENNLFARLESELAQQIGDTLWLMKRAERMQNGLALKRIKGAQEAWEMQTQPITIKAHEKLDCYDDLLGTLAPRRLGPTPDEIHAFVAKFKDDPSEEVQEFIILLKSLNKLPQGPERRAVRRKAQAQLQHLIERHQRVSIRVSEQLEAMQSPENLAAMLAPRNENSLHMQSMEDSNLRRLWRLTNMLFKIRDRALAHEKLKSEDRPDYVYENKSEVDKMSSENVAFLQENAPNEQ